MERYKAILSYDGTTFRGFQRQANGRTVQGEVEAALTRLGWQGASIFGAGRTDSGVHASGQVIAFDLEWKHAPEGLANALNALLPEAIAVQAVVQAPVQFHPRFDAAARRYVYHLICRPHRDPLKERYAWRVWPAPDIEALNDLAAEFIGEHDFRNFGSPQKPGGSTVRKVNAAGWSMEGENGLQFEIEANAFLFRMVRRIVKAQVEAAAGRIDKNMIGYLISGQAPEMFQGLAPPQGLTLAEVSYPDDGE